MAGWGSLSPCACLGTGQSLVAACPAQAGDRGGQRRDGHTALCPWDPSPGQCPLAAPGPRPPEGSGVHASAADCCTAPGRPIFERDLSRHGGSLNPFQSRSLFSCGGNTSGGAQGLRLERIWPHVPARGQREPSGRVPGAAGGRGARGHRREGPREPGGSWPGGTGSALKFPTSARERRPGLSRCWGPCGNSRNVLFSGFKPVM